jgi:hypothetical protein
MKPVKLFQVNARHLAVFTVVLASLLILLGSATVSRVNEIEAACGTARRIDFTLQVEEQPPADVIPPPKCLKEPDDDFVHDQDGNPICTEAM